MNQEQWNVKTPEHVSLQFKLAGLGSRGAAQLIDMVLLFIMYAGIAIAGVFLGSLDVPWLISKVQSFVLAIIIIVIFLIFWGYFFLFEVITGGRTPGKMLLGVRVIQEDGSSATSLSLLVRNLLRIIDMLPAYYLLGLMMIFLHPGHKRIGDLVAGTIVVHERKKKKPMKKRKPTKIEKEINNRGVSAEDIKLDDSLWRNFTQKEWTLLKAYITRYPQLTAAERSDYSREVAGLLFPKAGLEINGKTASELQDMLLAFYLQARQEWEFEL
ncbi:RDD family protein [Halobacillus rhizosphaerae]|uniref:RDD family protein n=1 Tax=Halobacillus rhizosphaerae TaxID=3064889 RepID=UPI00398BA096